MDRRLKIHAFAAPLAAASLACAWMFAPQREMPRPPLSLVEHCRRAAELLYDVSWAAACLKTADDSTDCMLPDAQAARVNAILVSEEARCMSAETQARASP